MKKTFLLLFFLVLSISGYSQRPYISGASTTCAVRQKYTIENVTCFIKIKEIIITGNGFYRPHPTEENSFYVDWINLTNQNLNEQINVKYEYNQRNFSIPQIQGNQSPCTTKEEEGKLAKPVTIKADPVGTPNPVTNGLSNFFPKKHTFATSAYNASRYRWNIQGGSIIGCDTCSSIQVQANPGVCTITGTVSAENACGRRSDEVSFSKTISRPSSISNINGPTYVGAYGDFKLYSVSLHPDATSYNWYFAPGSQFLGYSNSNSISVACNTNSTTATTLYVVAQNSCGQSSVKGKTITGGINPPYRSFGKTDANTWKNITNTTIVQDTNSQITVLVPNYKQISAIDIFTLSGKKVKTFSPTEIENKINTSSWTSGIYILMTNDGTQRESIKFQVK